MLPIRMRSAQTRFCVVDLNFRFLKIKAAKGGIKKSAMMSDAVNAAVLVNAKGRNNLPSAPINVNTGIKLIMVVSTAVTIAPETSAVAL